MSLMVVLILERLKVSNCPIYRLLSMLILFPAAKQCYHCQGLGHVQADCPTLRLNGGATGTRCYTCGQIGHLARNCPNPNSQPNTRGGGVARGGYGGGFRGGMVSNNRAATCYKCGGPNHYARDCQAQAMKCYACGKLVRLWCRPSEDVRR
jgi:cellular nucleic acid-binding protein